MDELDKEETKTTTTQTVTAPTEPATTTSQTQTTAKPAISGHVLGVRIIYYVLGVILVLLAFRFGLALLGANRENGFASFIFDISGVFAQPFFTLFNYHPSYGVSKLEVYTLVAMVVYTVVAAGAVGLIKLPYRNSNS